MARSGTNPNGPGYTDVADFLIELSGTWGGLHRFRVAADRDRRGVPCLFVVLEHSPVNGKDCNDKACRAWSQWPCASNSTFAAMLFRLCFELNEKLERRKVTREAQTFF